MESLTLSLKQQFVRHKSRIDLLYRYVTGQGLVQIFNVLNGFFLLRWLSIEEQAKFSMAMGIMATLSILGDLGFGGSLIGLIGNRINDKVLIGQYIRGIQFYKNRLLLICLTVGAVLVAYYNQQQEWGFDFWIIYALLMVGVHAQSVVGYYAVVLQVKQNLTGYYRPQIISSASRFIITFLLFSLTNLNAVKVVLLITLTFVCNAWWMKQSAEVYFLRSKIRDIALERSIIKILTPVIPMVVFYGVQGQFMTFMVGIYGKSQNIAEVGALARLSQLFALLTPFNSIVLMPYFARATNSQLIKRFFMILLIAVFVLTPILLMAYFCHDIFIVLLGEKFNTVRSEVSLYILTACIGYLSSIVWAINMARKWNTWYSALIYVLITVGVQFFCIKLLDLSTTHGVIVVGFFTVSCSFLIYFLTSIIGLIKERNWKLRLV